MSRRFQFSLGELLGATTAAGAALGCAGHMANEGPTRAWAYGMFDFVGFSTMAGVVIGVSTRDMAKGAALGFVLGVAVYLVTVVVFW